MKQSVCLWMRHRNGSVLSVSQSKKTGVPEDWNLPGGKVEEGETLKQAIRRETREETGIDIPEEDFSPIFQQECHIPMTSLVTVFEADWKPGMVARSSIEGETCWVYPAQVIASHVRFSKFNRDLFKHVGLEISAPQLLQHELTKNTCPMCGKADWMPIHDESDRRLTEYTCSDCDEFRHDNPKAYEWVSRVVEYQIQKALASR